MAYNNTVTLTGNMGSEAKIVEQEGKRFAVFSIATTDSYQDDNQQWQQKESVWHKIIAFNPHTVEKVKNLKTGTRIEITGPISYRPFETMLEDGLMVKKMEASVIAAKLKLKPLVKKQSA